MKPITPEPQKYVKFYFQDGFIKTDTNLSSLEILGVIERIKYSSLAQSRIAAEAHMKEAAETKLNINVPQKWTKLDDHIIYKTYKLSKAAKKKKAVKKPTRKQTKAN